MSRIWAGMIGLALWSCMIPLSACAAGHLEARWNEPSPRAEPLIVGVQVHFGEKVKEGGYRPSQTQALITELGVGSIRDSLNLARMEDAQGQPDVASENQTLLEMARWSGLDSPPLLTVNGAPRRIPPSDPAFFPATIRLASEAVERAPPGTIIELWNEWDKSSHFDPSVDAYVRMIDQVVPALRRASGNRPIVIGAAADAKAWTESLIASGALEAVDGLSVHLYNHCSREASGAPVMAMFHRLDAIREAMLSEGQDKPVYVSEVGWPTGGECGIEEQTVADNLARFVLTAPSRPWLRGVWFYELKDSGIRPADRESHFGIYRFDGSPKAIPCAFAEATRLVRRADILGYFEKPDISGVKVRIEEETYSIIWSNRNDRALTVRLHAPVRSRRLCDRSFATTEHLTIGSRPIIVAGDVLSRL